MTDSEDPAGPTSQRKGGRGMLVLAFCLQQQQLHGRSPTVREIATALGLSTSTVQGHLRRLQVRGFLYRMPYVHRGIVLRDAADAQRGLNHGKNTPAP